MNVENGVFHDAAGFVGKLPTHAVFDRTKWQQSSSEASYSSLHWSFDSAVSEAAKLEYMGERCTVVCFSTGFQPVSPEASA